MDSYDRFNLEQHIGRLDMLIDEIDDLDKETIKEKITKEIYDDVYGIGYFLTKKSTNSLLNEERRKKYLENENKQQTT